MNKGEDIFVYHYENTPDCKDFIAVLRSAYNKYNVTSNSTIKPSILILSAKRVQSDKGFYDNSMFGNWMSFEDVKEGSAEEYYPSAEPVIPAEGEIALPAASPLHVEEGRARSVPERLA